LFGNQDRGSELSFIGAVLNNARPIAAELDELANVDSGAIVIQTQETTLSNEQISKWRETVTDAPTLETLKIRNQDFPLEDISRDRFVSLLVDSLMLYDKHRPLDLVLYRDSREEVRKWARNRIREIKLETLRRRVQAWSSEIREPEPSHLLAPHELKGTISQLLAIMDGLDGERIDSGAVEPYEKVSPGYAHQSARQLLVDLSEAIMRADTCQNFLSTSLFVFWAADELLLLHGSQEGKLEELGGRLLRHYIASAIVERKRQGDASA
jgi:hypothetical protein